MSIDLDQELPRLLEWLVGGNQQLPPAVEARARLLLLDSIACLIAGISKEEVQQLARSLSVTDGGAISYPGFTCAEPELKSLSTSAAALICGVATCWDEACEGLARAHGRPGLHTFAAVLPLAIAREASMGELLRALTVGFEVGARMGEALRIYPGMHVDGTWGTFGAVAGACVLLGCSNGQLLDAINGAACQLPYSLYRPVGQGRTVRNLYPGLAASRAIAHALASRAGIDSPQGGFADLERVFRPVTNWTPAGTWLIEEGYLKPYAAVRHVHYGASAACERFMYNQDTTGIEAIELNVYEEAQIYCGNRAPQSPIAAQFSLSYGIAHALVFGDLGADAYLPGRLTDPEVNRLETLIEVVPDSAYGERRGAVLRVETDAGVETYTSANVPGDADNPMDKAAVEEKFLRYTSPVLGASAAKALLASMTGASAEDAVRSSLRLA